MKAMLPLNEKTRLEVLLGFHILDTGREQSFDDIAQIAMMVCEVPIAVVSLVDRDRQWFKSCLGLDATETPRDVAFCAHAILTPSTLMVVEDAQDDSRFFDNPLVTGTPHIRFYAGAPLVTDTGEALGTLCVIDYVPRQLTDLQKKTLTLLSGQVMQLLQLRETNELVRQHAENFRSLSDSVPVLIGQLDKNQRYIFGNNKYQEWFGLDVKDILGKTPVDVFGPERADALTAHLQRSYGGEQAHYEIVTVLGRTLGIDYVPQLTPQGVSGMFIIGTDITEQKNHRSALERERESLDLVIKGANVGTWQWNVQSGEAIFNERWAEIVGYSLAELAPVSIATWLRLGHPDDLPLSAALLEQHFRGEIDFYDCKCRMKHKAGHWVWVSARGRVASFTPDGRPLLMFGTHSDITELQRYQDKLQESEERLQSMLSNFPGAVYRCDNNRHWTMHYLSAAIHELTGYAAEDFLNDAKRSLTDITHPDDIARLFDSVQQALHAHIPFDLVYRIQRADGQWRWMEEVGTGVYNAQGELKFIDGFIWDVTGAEESRTAIKLNEQKLSSLYNLSPVAIVLNRFSDGQFLECNPEFHRMTGYNQEEFVQLNYWDITPREYETEELKQLDSLRTTGRYGPYEKNFIHRNGHFIPVLLNGVLIDSPNGEKQIWSIVQDITERKRIEQMKNEFVSAVSHELRTPLTSISGSLGLVINGMLGEVQPKVKDMLGIAHKNCQRLTLLINDLLDMEKLLAGKMFFDVRTQYVKPILEQSIESNKAYADTYSVRLVLVAAEGAIKVALDAQRLQQVLANFLSNAVKFSPANGQVEVVLERIAETVKISVVDHGPGISDEFRERIFQKFSQADSSDSRKRGGTGLGLSISKELIERMDGTIGFVSEPGQGATFFAIFPIAKSDNDGGY